MSGKDFKISTIEINGYHDQPVGNRYFRLTQESTTLGIVFPGLHYTCDMPLLYYTTQLLLARNVDVIQLWSDYTNPSFQSLGPIERARWLEADASAALHAGLRQRQFHQSLLVGKSLGTLSMALLLNKQSTIEKIATIWLTPLLHIPEVSGILQRLQSPALYIGGDKDPTYDVAILRQIKENPEGKIIVIEGANHSLEIPGKVLLSLQIMETVMRKIADFLDHPAANLAQ